MKQQILARSLQTAAGSLPYPVITVEDGRIAALSEGEPNESREILTPAFFDIHVHGAVSHDFMGATPKEIDAIGCFLATKGVAHYLATTVTSDREATLRSLERLAAYTRGEQDARAAQMKGINLEGPFLCPAKRGVHPLDRILAPSVELFNHFQEAAEGQIRLMTVAPEMPGALELIEHATARGVRVSMGHSNATAAETLAGIAAGAVSATHTFNAMRVLDHREPGIAGTVLDREELYAEAIVDGIHVDAAMVRLWFKAKGATRGLLITDGMAAMGMPNGTYRLGDLVVEVKDGVCLSDGVLAGSVLTMERAVSNLCAMTHAPLASAVRMASYNPAAMLGCEQMYSLASGAEASFNVYDEQGERRALILRGSRISA